MTDAAISGPTAGAGGKLRRPDLSEARIRRRYAAERRFRLYGVLAIGFAVFMLGFLAVTIVAQGYSAFRQTRIALDVTIDRRQVDPAGTRLPEIARARRLPGADRAIRCATCSRRRSSRADRRALNDFVSNAAGDDVQAPGDGGSRPDRHDRSGSRCWPRRRRHAGQGPHQPRRGGGRPADQRPADRLDRQARGGGRASAARFNVNFFTTGDSREPEQAGVWGAVMGSFLTLVTALLLSLPDRRRGGDLSRGVRAQEPLDRHHRGQHQQSRGGALDRVRPAGPRGVPRLLRPAALARRWSAAWC